MCIHIVSWNISNTNYIISVLTYFSYSVSLLVMFAGIILQRVIIKTLVLNLKIALTC